MNAIAIIPARGGSKRIPRKNIKPFLGKPVIIYSIEAALSSGLFEEVMVSTEDDEIAEIAVKNGAKIPFLRSPETSNDFTHVGDVIREVLINYNDTGKTFADICCIYPAAPFVTAERIKEAYGLLISGKYDSVFSVQQYSSPVQRALKIENGKVSMIWPENLLKRSQDLMPAFHDAGQFYWMKTSEFLRQKKFFAENSGAILISDTDAHDIDTEEDWKLAEIKYRILRQG